VGGEQEQNDADADDVSGAVFVIYNSIIVISGVVLVVVVEVVVVGGDVSPF